MTNHEKTCDEKKADDAVRGKRPYETPTLTKLGSVKQVTQGIPDVPLPDDGSGSF
jgi:hypothetical protein